MRDGDASNLQLQVFQIKPLAKGPCPASWLRFWVSPPQRSHRGPGDLRRPAISEDADDVVLEARDRRRADDLSLGRAVPRRQLYLVTDIERTLPAQDAALKDIEIPHMSTMLAQAKMPGDSGPL